MRPDTLAEQNFQWLLDSAPDALIIVDAEGRIVVANPQVEQLFGYPRSELLGRSVEVLIPACFQQAHIGHRRAYAANPRTRPMGAGLALYGQRKDGSEFPLEISLSAIESADGTFSLAAIRDVSARKEAERELEQYRNHLEELVEERTAALTQANAQLQAGMAERTRIEANQARVLAELTSANEELRNFAYVVSHDLKAPLRAIGSLAGWISDDYARCFDAEGREQMALLISRVHRMDALIDGILEYSRLGRAREERALVDLEEVVREAIDLLSPPPHVEIRIVNHLPTLYAERTRMVQVFQNLLGNAIRHNDKPRGRITVACRATEGAWQLSVADNGPGIEPQHSQRIFQMFQTLAPRDKVESTGIGLTLVKRIIEMDGGRIWVESAPGKGATFHFTLPTSQPGGGVHEARA
jgi:two-component system, LuxR family, sensor kinase FixL